MQAGSTRFSVGSGLLLRRWGFLVVFVFCFVLFLWHNSQASSKFITLPVADSLTCVFL